MKELALLAAPAAIVSVLQANAFAATYTPLPTFGVTVNVTANCSVAGGYTNFVYNLSSMSTSIAAVTTGTPWTIACTNGVPVTVRLDNGTGTATATGVSASYTDLTAVAGQAYGLSLSAGSFTGSGAGTQVSASASTMNGTSASCTATTGCTASQTRTLFIMY